MGKITHYGIPVLILIILLRFIVDWNRLPPQVEDYKPLKPPVIKKTSSSGQKIKDRGISSTYRNSHVRDQDPLRYNRETSEPLPGKKCEAKRNVVFVKTFKTGGSTLSNILGRRAVKHRVMGFHNATLGKFKLLQGHMLYNRTHLTDVMPNDTFYVTQLRHPLTQLVSMLNFRRIHNVTDPLEHHSDHCSVQFYLKNSWCQLSIPKKVSLYELPLYLKQLDKEFDLITITEQFDLSLLLLRRKLCWDISDMMYVPLKTATYKFNKNIQSSNIKSNKKLNDRYKNLNPMAYRLYNYFNRTLSDLIIKAGPDLREELVYFQELNHNVSEYCSIYIEQIIHNASDFLKVVNSSKVLNIPTSRWGSARTVDPIECAMMKLHRMTFSSLLTKLDFNLTNTTMKFMNMKNWPRALAQPVHPKYGIPPEILTFARSYDILLRGR